MTTTYVALLRGVNVAGRGTLRMDELRRVFLALGYTEVATYIQSGNVIFTSDVPVDADSLQSDMGAELGADVTVMVRTAAELEGVVRRNPFGGADPSKLHVGFLARQPPAVSLDLQRFRPEEAIIDGREVYFHLPNGIGRAKLPPYLDRQLKVPVTVRNWNTVTKLAQLAGA